MKILVFDTETTWFINKKETDLDKQPQIIQFAGIFWEVETDESWTYNFVETKRVDIIINPWKPIPFGSSQVHHLYDIDVIWKPLFSEVSADILQLINTAEIIIWHNIEYDESMVLLELRRLEKEYLYKPKQVLCTMNSSINYCKLAKRDDKAEGYKRPKLWELHKKLFWEYFIWAHDALTDVEATLRCYMELINQDIIAVEEKTENVMSLF